VRGSCIIARVLALLVVGLALVAGSLLMGLYEAHVARHRHWDRPRWTFSSVYALFWSPARRLALAAGLLVLLLASRMAAAVVTVLLGALWGWMRWVRSTRHLARWLRQSVESARAGAVPKSEREALCEVLLARHPEWGTELVEQIVQENRTLPEVARVLVRMERGWPG
jgi:hypothetical protein